MPYRKRFSFWVLWKELVFMILPPFTELDKEYC
jgi:hypothetical protein